MEGKRRGLDNTVLVGCSRESEEADVKVTKWFKEGKSIILRGRIHSDIVSKGDVGDKPWYLFILPVDCLSKCYHLYQQQSQNQNISNKKKKDHSFRHTFPIPFELSYNIVHPQFAALYDASSVVLSSTIYFFATHSRKIYYLEGDIVDTTSSLNFKFAGWMISKRSVPKLVTLDGKIYAFGNNKDVWAEVFEPRPHRSEGDSKKLSSPIPASSASNVLFVVAIEKEKKIIVGFNFEFIEKRLVRLLYPDVEATKGIAVFIYDVAGDSWVKHTNNFLINPQSLLCEPIIVDGCLYWLDTKMMWAYDLNSNQYFEGPIEDGLFRDVVDTNSIYCEKVSLIHLVGDVFYLIWADGRDQVLHCTMIQALKSTTNLHANRFKLRTTVSCCQTFDSRLSPNLRDGALIL